MMQIEHFYSLMLSIPEPVVNGIFSIFATAVGSIFAYRQARKRAAADLARLERDQNLTTRREARVYMFQKQHELFERLSSSFVEACNAVSFLFPLVERGEPSGLEAKTKYREEMYKAAVDVHNQAQLSLRSAYPFVSKKTFQSGLDLLKIMRSHINAYGEKRVKPLCVSSDIGDFEVDDRFYRENHELYPKLDAFLETLKNDLDVMRLTVTEHESEKK